MIPGVYNFTIYQGKTWSRQITVRIDGVVVNYSTHSARWTFRNRHDSSSLLTLTSLPGGGLVLAAIAPNIVVTISAALSEALDFTVAVHELIVTSPDGIVIDALLRGQATLELGIAP